MPITRINGMVAIPKIAIDRWVVMGGRPDRGAGEVY